MSVYGISEVKFKAEVCALFQHTLSYNLNSSP